MKTYVGVNSIAQQVQSIYIGDTNGIAQKVIHAYVGDSNGIARKIFGNMELVSIPAMTSNTAPAGIASSSSEFSNARQPWQAFDKNYDTIWSNAKSDSSPYLVYDFGYSIIPISMTIKTNGNAAARRVRFQGKQAGSNSYENLTEYFECPNNDTVLEMQITTSTAYQTFRWLITSFYGSGSYARIEEANVFGYRS